MYSYHEPDGPDGGCGERRGRGSAPQDARSSDGGRGSAPQDARPDGGRGSAPQDARPDGGRGEPRQGFTGHGEGLARPRPAVRRKSFLVRKDGHVFTFVYPPEHELAALKALADCPNLDPAEVLALVCYLGRDPRELGEELF